MASKRQKAPRWEETTPIRVFDADPADIVRHSRKFDLIFKIRLAEAWAGGDAESIRRAETNYLEMQRARLSFFEDEPLRRTPTDFISSFRRLAESIFRTGFDFSTPPIPIETGTMELLNGAHRLACCTAYSRPCRFAEYGRVYFGTHGGSTFRAFRQGRIAESVENYGVREYLRFNEGARIVEASPARGEDEEAAISRIESELGCIVWHSKPTKEGFAFTVSPADGASGAAKLPRTDSDTVNRLFPELPEPDWRERARTMRPDRTAIERKKLKYRLTLPFKFGRKRRKAKLHIIDLDCRAVAFDALADYIEQCVPSKGFDAQ